MRVYIVYESDEKGTRYWRHFFLRSSLALIRRLIDADSWDEESKPSPWRRRRENDNVIWELPRAGKLVVLMPIKLAFRDWSPLRWFRQRCHWTNDNTREVGNKTVWKGSLLRAGRAWFHTKGHGRDLVHVQWILLKHKASWGFGVDWFDGDDQRDVSLSIRSPLLTFYFVLENIIPKRFASKHTWQHATGISWCEKSIMVQVWHSGADCYTCDGYRGSPKRWLGWLEVISPADVLMGRRDYQEETISTHDAALQMPEGAYPVKISMQKWIWTRRRWPFKLWPLIKLGTHIEAPNGVPVPGKGENSWDCGEDAIFSTGSSSTTVAGALASLYKSVMDTRERYGGRNWVPDAARAKAS